MALADNVSFARLALSIEAVELLVQSLLGRLARVDCATKWTAAAPDVGPCPSPCQPPTLLVRPKKRGPDQPAPVICRAIAVSER